MIYRTTAPALVDESENGKDQNEGYQNQTLYWFKSNLDAYNYKSKAKINYISL